MSLLLLLNNQVPTPAAGQTMPDVQILLETADDVMVDISGDYMSFTTTRGRNRELDQFQAGTAMVTLSDLNRDYDPANTAGPYYPNLKPMRALQITGTWDGTTWPVFTGYIDSIESTYAGPPNGAATTTIYATDGFKVLEAAQLATSAYAQEVLASGPVNWWRFDEPEGSTAWFDQLADNDLTVFGTPTFGEPGLVARDPSAAMTVTVPTTGGFSAGSRPARTALSAEILFRPSGSDDGGLLADLNDIETIGFAINAAGFTYTINAAVATTAGSTGSLSTFPTPVDDGQTHHVVVTWDGATAILYVDGVAVDSAALAGEIPAFTSKTFIAGYTYEGGSFDGALGTYDEAAIYDRALTAAEVAAHYEALNTPWDADTPKERLDRVLDAAGWPTSLRELDTGTSTLQPAELDTTALEHAQKTAASDFGVLFMKADGRVRFIGRAGLFNQANMATFGDPPIP